ncbi:MAG: DUF1127 domain-containing protein [Rhizobiales bacterium]|nr:DUF1127 domain-containing protein [Hyphomicrobiales bacterium]
MHEPQRVKPSHPLYLPISSIPVWKILWRRYCAWQSLRRSREALLHLSDVQLRDVGISREQAVAEADRNRGWL